jgi:hypothetical protein
MMSPSSPQMHAGLGIDRGSITDKDALQRALELACAQRSEDSPSPSEGNKCVLNTSIPFAGNEASHGISAEILFEGLLKKHCA